MMQRQNPYASAAPAVCGPTGGPGVYGGPRYPADSVGFSAQPYENPMQPYDDQGWGVPLTQSPLFAPPLFVNVESARRDIALYPDPANFTLHFSRPIEGLRSIELIDITTPTLQNAALAPVNDYFFLYNGKYDTSSNSFQPQNVVKMYDTMNMATPQTAQRRLNDITRIKDPTTPQFPEYTGPEVTQRSATRYKAGAGAAAVMYPYADFAVNSFGKYTYNSNLPVQYWERRNARKVFYFKPELGQLDHLDFCLVDREGRLYDILGDSPPGEWTATLLITAKQH